MTNTIIIILIIMVLIVTLNIVALVIFLQSLKKDKKAYKEAINIIDKILKEE